MQHHVDDRLLERVARVGRTSDARPVAAARVAALPAVAVADRLGAAPRAPVGGQRLTLLGRSGDRRRRRIRRRSGRDRLDDGGGDRGRRVGAVGVPSCDRDLKRVADVLLLDRVGRCRRALDARPVTAVRVAALPLVAIGDRLGAAPGALVDGHRLALLGRSGDRRGRSV